MYLAQEFSDTRLPYPLLLGRLYRSGLLLGCRCACTLGTSSGEGGMPGVSTGSQHKSNVEEEGIQRWCLGGKLEDNLLSLSGYIPREHRTSSGKEAPH